MFRKAKSWLAARSRCSTATPNNRGRTALAPVPLTAYETRAVTFNFVYLPGVSEINEVATLGFWATLWLGSGL